jgi:hypothetical protein
MRHRAASSESRRLVQKVLAQEERRKGGILMQYAEALDHKAAVRKAANSKPTLAHVRIEEAENGGHSIEHHFESGSGAYHEPKTYVFGKPEGPKPKLPKGHVLQHVAEHMGIPHEVMGKSEEPEEEGEQE